MKPVNIIPDIIVYEAVQKHYCIKLYTIVLII